jgi:hypothetical protein
MVFKTFLGHMTFYGTTTVYKVNAKYPMGLSHTVSGISAVENE